MAERPDPVRWFTIYALAAVARLGGMFSVCEMYGLLIGAAWMGALTVRAGRRFRRG